MYTSSPQAAHLHGRRGQSPSMPPWPPQASPTPKPAWGLLWGSRCQQEYVSIRPANPLPASPDKHRSIPSQEPPCFHPTGARPLPEHTVTSSPALGRCQSQPCHQAHSALRVRFLPASAAVGLLCLWDLIPPFTKGPRGRCWGWPPRRGGCRGHGAAP